MVDEPDVPRSPLLMPPPDTPAATSTPAPAPAPQDVPDPAEDVPLLLQTSLLPPLMLLQTSLLPPLMLPFLSLILPGTSVPLHFALHSGYRIL